MTTCGPSCAHEFWIEPVKYQVPKGETLTADLRNGQNFAGAQHPFFDHQIRRAEVNGQSYRGRMGDLPAFSVDEPAEGLTTIVIASQPGDVKYKSWDSFQTFLDEKDLQHAAETHRERGLPNQDFWERYLRHSKALIASGHGRGQDRRHGLFLEFVVMANPYATQADALPVQLWRGERVLADTQIGVFDRASDGSVTHLRLRSDASGMAEIPVSPGHSYLLDAVMIAPVNDDDRAVWQTDWATLTFAIPGR
ncbi:MAG: DUF4198 domain-containing protein [Paracoccaceae bacterium]